VSEPHIVVADYDAAWPRRADVVIAAVLAASNGLVQRVEHIGSTAIPGMAAKDVIDLQASVADLDQAAAVLESPLRALGFERLPYDCDHVPAGSNDDPDRWAKRIFVRRDHPDGAVNLHVRLTGSPNERLALLFRDWFRAHPESVPAYAAFKRTLAAEVAAIDVYSDLKDPVVDLVVSVAESWATSTGWNPRGSRT
jgi:GrpB-like predicted nucleotidyltransferase (UPF0157 family)